MAIVQFQGETRHEAIVNHFSLDIQEEEDFFNFLSRMGYSENSDDETIESLIQTFREIVD